MQEKPSPTQNKLSKEDVISKIKDNLNYIYITLMFLVNFFVSTLDVSDGSVGLRYPSTFLGWIMFLGTVAFSVLIGVFIMNSFRKQGVKLGTIKIKDVYDKYKSLISNNSTEKQPRSLDKYMSSAIKKDTIVKACVLIVLNLFFGSAAIAFSLNNLLSLVSNIIMSIAFGIRTMISAEEFVTEELVLFYKLKIKELKEKENGEI